MKKDVKTIRIYLSGGPNAPVDLLDDKELLAVIEDGYIFFRIKNIAKVGEKKFTEEVRRLYEVNDRVKV